MKIEIVIVSSFFLLNILLAFLVCIVFIDLFNYFIYLFFAVSSVSFVLSSSLKPLD